MNPIVKDTPTIKKGKCSVCKRTTRVILAVSEVWECAGCLDKLRDLLKKARDTA